MKYLRTVAVLAMMLFCFAAASSAATKFTCNSAGKVWSFTPGTSPVEITAMFANANTDCDLFVDDGSGTIVVFGVSVESRYESIKFGPLPGVAVRLTALKSSGPNSKGYLRGADSMGFLRAGQAGGFKEIGRAVDLAKRDPAYAKVLEQLRSYQRLKRPAAQE